MAITESIQTARDRGANPDAILDSIIRQNPAKAVQFTEARKRGASSDAILNEVLKQNGARPPVPPAVNAQQVAQTPPPKTDLLEKTSGVLSSIFPGAAKLGEAVATSGQAALQFARGDSAGAKETLKGQVPVPQVIGGALESMAFPASLALPGSTAVTAGGRIAGTAGQFGGLSAIEGLGSAMREGKSAVESVKKAISSGVVGAVTGAIFGTVSEAAKYAVNNLPKDIVKAYFPTKSKADITELALDKKLGTVATMKQRAENQVKVFASQIDDLLNSAGEDGGLALRNTPIGKDDVYSIVNHALGETKGYEGAQDLFDAAKTIAPSKAYIVDKLSKGTATVKEVNELRSALDMVNFKKFEGVPGQNVNLPAVKELAVNLQDSLRNYVKTIEPRTIPIFDSLAKEITWRKVLAQLDKGGSITKRALFDSLAGIAGAVTGGLPGFATGIAVSEAARSPSVGLGAAKVLNKAGEAGRVPLVRKVAEVAGRVGKAFTTKLIGQ